MKGFIEVTTEESKFDATLRSATHSGIKHEKQKHLIAVNSIRRVIASTLFFDAAQTSLTVIETYDEIKSLISQSQSEN